MSSQDNKPSQVMEQVGPGSFPELNELKTLCASRLPADRPYYVLHLDDEIHLHDLFAEVIRNCGLKLHAVADPQSALEFIKEHPSDIVLIISDFQMPDINGFQFRQQALEVNPSIPFAILSAFVDRDMALKGLDLKIAAFLEKPVDFSKVAALLSKDGLSRLKALREDE